MRILIVDDSKSVHNFCAELFKKAKGVELVSAFDGDEAVAALMTEGPFDVVLLDWEMPKKPGPQTLADIKARGIQVPVVMMTTKNSPDDIMKMLQAGAAEYLMKPFTADILFEKIAYACGRPLSHVA